MPSWPISHVALSVGSGERETTVKAWSPFEVVTYVTPAHSSFCATANARSVGVSLNQSVVTLRCGEGDCEVVTERSSAFRAGSFCAKDSMIESECCCVVAVENNAWAGVVAG